MKLDGTKNFFSPGPVYCVPLIRSGELLRRKDGLEFELEEWRASLRGVLRRASENILELLERELAVLLSRRFTQFLPACGSSSRGGHDGCSIAP